MKHYYICTFCILHLCRNCRDFVAATGHVGHRRVLDGRRRWRRPLPYLFLFPCRKFSDFAFSYIVARARVTFMTVLRALLHKGNACNFTVFTVPRGPDDKDTISSSKRANFIYFHSFSHLSFFLPFLSSSFFLFAVLQE